MTDHQATSRPDKQTVTGWRRWLRALAVAACAGGAVAWWAAAQLDTTLTGQPVQFGFWSAFWGSAAALIGFGVGAWGPVGRAIVVSALVLLAALFVVWLMILPGVLGSVLA